MSKQPDVFIPFTQTEELLIPSITLGKMGRGKVTYLKDTLKEMTPVFEEVTTPEALNTLLETLPAELRDRIIIIDLCNDK